MSHTDPRPDFGEDADTVFESMMDGILSQTADLEEEFESLDVKQTIERRSAANEAIVINFLQDAIPDVAALKKMLESLRQTGVAYPTCDNVMTIIEEMASHDDYGDYPDEFFCEMSRMDKFAIIIEQVARSETRITELSKDDIFSEIVLEELFTPEEREALVDATELFLASE